MGEMILLLRSGDSSCIISSASESEFVAVVYGLCVFVVLPSRVIVLILSVFFVHCY